MNPRLLIADADAESLDLARRFFLNCGYTVEIAAGDVECMKKLHRFHPDALLLAWELPWGGDGVLACLREDAAFATIPVFVISRNGQPQNKEALAPPVVAFYQAPYRLSQLHNRLQNGSARPRQELLDAAPAL